MLVQRDIEKIWGQYEKFLNALEDENVNRLLEEQGQRIIEASYSQREKEPFCGIGGVVDYSLKLMSNVKKLNDALGYQQSTRDIISSSLLSSIGYIGNLKEDRFVMTTSEWHKEKLGQHFDWNESCTKYSVQDMSLWFLQHYNVRLDWNVWQAILLSKNVISEESKFYANHKERLAILLSTAREITLKNETDSINMVYSEPF